MSKAYQNIEGVFSSLQLWFEVAKAPEKYEDIPSERRVDVIDRPQTRCAFIDVEVTFYCNGRYKPTSCDMRALISFTAAVTSLGIDAMCHKILIQFECLNGSTTEVLVVLFYRVWIKVFLII